MRFHLLLVLFLMKITVSAQTHLNSSDLAKSISFKTFSFEGTLSRFSEKLSNLEDKEITLIGYFLVLNCKQSDFMLSKNKMASCSFYGNSGPETVLGLKFLTKPSFKIDQLR